MAFDAVAVSRGQPRATLFVGFVFNAISPILNVSRHFWREKESEKLGNQALPRFWVPGGLYFLICSMLHEFHVRPGVGKVNRHGWSIGGKHEANSVRSPFAGIKPCASELRRSNSIPVQFHFYSKTRPIRLPDSSRQNLNLL